jgi:CrcB protein
VSTWERIIEYAAIAAGGVVGSLARAALDAALPAAANAFPWSTFLANVSGSLLLGSLSALLQIRAAPPPLRLFVTVGVLGSYTTFSTFALQLNQLIAAHHPAIAAIYVSSSLLLGLAAATFGFHLVERRAALAP